MALMTFQAADVNSGAAYTLAHNPASIIRPHPHKRTATVKTFSSYGSFNWGFPSVESGMVGERVILHWPAMRVSTDWTKLQAYYETRETVTWDPQEKAHDGVSTYEVVVVRLDGDDYGTNLTYRQNVELELEIRRVI